MFSSVRVWFYLFSLSISYLLPYRKPSQNAFEAILILYFAFTCIIWARLSKVSLSLFCVALAGLASPSKMMQSLAGKLMLIFCGVRRHGSYVGSCILFQMDISMNSWASLGHGGWAPSENIPRGPGGSCTAFRDLAQKSHSITSQPRYSLVQGAQSLFGGGGVVGLQPFHSLPHSS